MHETKIEQVNHDEPLESHDQQASTPDTIVERPPHPRSAPSSYSVASTDDEELPDPLLLEEGIPSTVPLEALAARKRNVEH
ncbi:hypothetical protein CU098_007586 [Rhizopus stolonifer]|uniref:Uncharacterized protein n=1 Tax=Rhizopus stolonifer TaxID=4846 RepID=A0A367KLF9_RHIST|nr:hypothetical protein CU098_007586 [Rhizopus stolonifer]